VGCAKELAKHDVPVTVLDRNDYHQFQPLLYQVATAELATADIARPLRAVFKRQEAVVVHRADVADIDLATRTVTASDGRTFTGDFLVVAAGSQPNFFQTPGASEHACPLYTVQQAEALRTRLLELIEEVDANPALIEQGALNFVILGAGPTGVETAGALADAINDVIPKRYHGVNTIRARIYLIDHAQVVLGAFSDRAHTYAAEKLQHNGVQLVLGTGVSKVSAGKVTLSDGTEIPSRAVVWAGASRRRSWWPSWASTKGGAAGSRPSPISPSTASPASTPSATWPTCPTTTATTSPSSARSRSKQDGGRPRTSSPTWTASRASRSTTRTRASWP
jgi:NADH dehydrogenase